MGKSLTEEMQEYTRRSSPEYVKTTLDTMNALTWPSNQTRRGRGDREELAQGRLRSMERMGPEWIKVLTKAQSLKDDWQERYMNDEDVPHWQTGGNAILQAQADAFQHADSTAAANRTTTANPDSTSSYRIPKSNLGGGMQQAIQQNGVVWIGGQKWIEDPYDPETLIPLNNE